MADKLMQAGCEIATKKVQGPQQLGLRADKAAGEAAAPRRAGDEDRTKPRNRFRIREASGYSGATGAAGEVQRACQADQENPRQIVGAMAAEVGADRARISVKSKPQRGGGHWAR